MISKCLLFIFCAILAVNAFAQTTYCPTVPLIKEQHSGNWVAPPNWTIVQKVKLSNLHPIKDPSSTLARIGESEQDGKKVCSYLFTPRTCTVCILKLKQN